LSSAPAQISASHHGCGHSTHESSRHAHGRRYAADLELHDGMSLSTLVSKRMMALRWSLALLVFCSCAWAQNGQNERRVIEILADHDSRYQMEGQKQPVLKLKAGEEITLRITAKKAKNVNRNGAIHGFTLLHAKDRGPVDDWDFELKPGVQEFNVTAPSEPGE